MSIRNRITRSLAMVSALLLVGGNAIAARQTPPSVSVTRAVSQPLTLTSADLETMPRATVTKTNNGIATTYEGVWLANVLKKAGASLGAMRGAGALDICARLRLGATRSCSRSLSSTRR